MSVDPQPFSLEALAETLMADPNRFRQPDYVEMGVPMFLIGEGDALGDAPLLARPRATDRLGHRLAELAGALALRKPHLDVRDIGLLLEALADRHFVPYDAADPRDEAMASTAIPLPAAAPPVLAELTTAMAQARTFRQVNFHATPRYREAEFRRQIEAFARNFEPITPANFAQAVDGRWSHARPGMMPALFEGYRDNRDVLLPILEEFGFTAWFFVPSGFLSVPAHEQRRYAAAHRLHLPETDEYPDERVALTWDEARDIAQRGHVFACHTRTHCEVTPDTPRAVLENEIVAAKAEMEAELGATVEIFCWLEGAALGVNSEADEMLRQAGFRYLISNFKIQTL